MNTQKQYRYYFTVIFLSACVLLVMILATNLLLNKNLLHHSWFMSFLVMICVATFVLLVKLIKIQHEREQFKKIFGKYPEKFYFNDILNYFANLVILHDHPHNKEKSITYKRIIYDSRKLAKIFGFIWHNNDDLDQFISKHRTLY